MSRAARGWVSILTLGIACASPLGSQAPTPTPPPVAVVIRCENLSRPPCLQEISSGERQTAIRIHVLGANDNQPVPGATVRFRPAAGNMLSESVKTDEDGVGQTIWLRGTVTDTTGIAVEATSGGGSAIAFITVAPDTIPQYGITLHGAYAQAGFEKHHLPSPILLEIIEGGAAGYEARIMDADVCAARRVAFRNVGANGTMDPDTARGRVVHSTLPGDTLDTQYQTPGQDKGMKRCIVEMNWQLGDGPGYRRGRATLIGGSRLADRQTVNLRGRATALPRVIAGPVLTGFGGTYYAKRTPTGQVTRVERILPDGTKVAYDSVPPGSRVDTISNAFNATTMIGVSGTPYPLVPITLAVGMNLNDPGDDWFAGISLLRTFLPANAIPIDFTLLTRWGRRTELVDAEACAVDRDQCDTERRTRIFGHGLLISVDASSLVADALKKLGT